MALYATPSSASLNDLLGLYLSRHWTGKEEMGAEGELQGARVAGVKGGLVPLRH